MKKNVRIWRMQKIINNWSSSLKHFDFKSFLDFEVNYAYISFWAIMIQLTRWPLNLIHYDLMLVLIHYDFPFSLYLGTAIVEL